MKQTAVVYNLFRDKKDHQNDGVMARVTPGMPLAMASPDNGCSIWGLYLALPSVSYVMRP